MMSPLLKLNLKSVVFLILYKRYSAPNFGAEYLMKILPVQLLVLKCAQ